jgi:hypothetical protein
MVSNANRSGHSRTDWRAANPWHARVSPERIEKRDNAEAAAIDGKPAHHMQGVPHSARKEARTVMTQLSGIGIPRP